MVVQFEFKRFILCKFDEIQRNLMKIKAISLEFHEILNEVFKKFVILPLFAGVMWSCMCFVESCGPACVCCGHVVLPSFAGAMWSCLRLMGSCGPASVQRDENQMHPME